jgi:two-component system NtrC family sensor kinase
VDPFSVSFADTGVGIASDEMSKLFDPFYTTKKKGKGVGLGLSVVYGIIKAHKGSITVDSLPEKGSTFIIQLPLSLKSARGARNIRGDRGRIRKTKSPVCDSFF